MRARVTRMACRNARPALRIHITGLNVCVCCFSWHSNFFQNQIANRSSSSLFISVFFKAIELDGSNPVFYCNRAAAHSKMNNHHLAIEDCQRAIDMDPHYSKELREKHHTKLQFCTLSMARDFLTKNLKIIGKKLEHWTHTTYRKEH